MIPSNVERRVILNRLGFIQEYLQEIRSLPLASSAAFTHERKNVAAAESYVRRCLEALLDVGRHILTRVYAKGVTEYKDVARQLKVYNVVDDAEFQLLLQMAGYRNRMVHFYHEVTPDELYRICTTQLGDIERVADAYRRWMHANPQLVSNEL